MGNLPLLESFLPIVHNTKYRLERLYIVQFMLCIDLTFDVIKKEIKNFVGFDNVDISTAAI